MEGSIMKTITTFISVLLLVLFSALTFAKDVYVNGYTRSDGTYVAPYYRSSPNKSYNDNWSTSPNTNPYTGKKGTRKPTYNDKSPKRYGR